MIELLEIKRDEDFLNLKKDLDLFVENKIEYFHIDIMDGHYVRNFSLGVGFCDTVSKYTGTSLDIHFMTDNPDEIIPIFASCK